MKKILLVAMLVVFGVTASNSQTKTKTKVKSAKKAVTSKVVVPQVEGAGMLFENETIDYGTIQHNANGEREFVFTNNGNKPLIITSATGSCGCTVPTYPKDPIMPGAKASINVKYDTSRAGTFQKTVTIKSNSVAADTKVLTIKGNVLPDATKDTPVKS